MKNKIWKTQDSTRKLQIEETEEKMSTINWSQEKSK